MTEDSSSVEGNEAEPAVAWVCANCGYANEADQDHCVNCGFHRDYDPEAAPAVDFSSVKRQLDAEAQVRRRDLAFYMQIAGTASQLILLAAFIVMSVFVARNWPVHDRFDTEAGELADQVLTLQVRVEQGITKGDYDDLLVPLKVAKNKFTVTYGNQPERLRQAYQKLVQAAEYYEIARDSWEHALISNGSFGRADPNALSTDADEDVTRYWTTAASNALMALEDLR